MIIDTVKPFQGQHCETTATGTLLRQLNIELSEPMLFGIGEGLGFIFWNMKSMALPFLGGRIKPDVLTQNIARNLNLKLIVNETSSKERAWKGVKALINSGQVVGLKLDCYHLEYFSRPIHFAGHYAALYGYDEHSAYMIDTKQQGIKVKTSLTSLALARAEKGPMASKNLYYTIQQTGKAFDLKKAVLAAIRNNASQYLNPPITNIGFKGILKASTAIVQWFENSNNIENDFKTIALMMEKAGTGGALFRNLYRDFLQECYDMLKLNALKSALEAFSEIATLWTTVAMLFDKTRSVKDFQCIQEASEILRLLSHKEMEAMELLRQVSR
jgi:hypothetical protein